MLIAVSGSQGCGKSTVMAEIERRGYPVVTRKSSRSILTDWNVTLQQVNDNHDLTLEFQDEIIKRKFDDEKKTLEENPGKIVFTERTYADLFTYALVTLGKDNDHSDWIDQYYNECARLQQSYDSVFYLPAGKFDVVSDGVRGDNQHYSTMVDVVMYRFTKQMTAVKDNGLRVVEPVKVEDRVDFIEEVIGHL